MTKRYKLTLATKEQCTANALKFEGQEVRTRLWLMGVAHGISFMAEAATNICPSGLDHDQVHFNVAFSNNRYFYIDCDSPSVIENIRSWLKQYACTLTEYIPPCPSCHGERELDGRPGIYYCGHCGMRTT